MTVHTFEGSSYYEKKCNENPWINDHVFEIFPLAESIIWENRKPQQKLGIDAWLMFPEGSVPQTIDYKYRQWCMGENPDVLLEYYSDEKKQTPGWARNSKLVTDYVVYVYMPDKATYVFDSKVLHRLLRKNHDEWVDKANKGKDGFGWSRADNTGKWGDWTTLNMIVPLYLLDELGAVVDLRIGI